MLKGNLSIFINTRGGEFDKFVEEFNTAAKNGAAGISDYLETLNKKLDLETGSTFRDPYVMSKEEEQEFYNAVKNIDYDTSNYSEDRAMKKYFTDWYRKNGAGPGDDKMNKKLASHRKEKERAAETNKQVLDNIGELLFSSVFQAKLQHSTPKEIDSRVQNFLA
tara:strand:- start:63 stop:554 length:492 start_codon:yes stop_codon:yes gene_type:complete